jgi:hypothetical protein
MSNLMSSSKRTLIYGAIIFSATLVSGVGVNYVLAGSPDAEDVGAELTADVASGEITQEEADKKLAGLEERLEAWKKREAEGLKAKEDFRRITLEDVEARLKAGVDAGGLTQEQADERLEVWKKDQAEGLKAREDSRRITLEDVEARLKAGVDAGGLTQEQADDRLEAWKKDQAKGQ